MSILHMALFKVYERDKCIRLKALFDQHYPKILNHFDIEHYSFTAHNDAIELAEIKFPGCLLMIQFHKAEDYTSFLNDKQCEPHKVFKKLLMKQKLVNFPDDIQVFDINNFKEYPSYSSAA